MYEQSSNLSFRGLPPGTNHCPPSVESPLFESPHTPMTYFQDQPSLAADKTLGGPHSIPPQFQGSTPPPQLARQTHRQVSHRKTQSPGPRAHHLGARASNSLSLPNRVLPKLKLPALTSVPSKLTSTLSLENSDPTCVPCTGDGCPPSDSSFPAPPPYIQTHSKDSWAQR